MNMNEFYEKIKNDIIKHYFFSSLIMLLCSIYVVSIDVITSKNIQEKLEELKPTEINETYVPKPKEGVWNKIKPEGGRIE